MATVILIEASPWSSADGSVQVQRLAGGGRAGRAYNGYRGFDDWKSGVTTRPFFTTSIGFDETGWTGGAVPQTASIQFMPSLPATFDALSALQWVDAPVTIYSGDDKDGPPSTWLVELTGKIAGASAVDGALSLTIADLATVLDVKLLTGRFGGTGGVDGPPEAEGRIKRRTWGQVSNVEGQLLDKANSIYEFGDPALPIQSFDAVRDKARAGVAGAPIAWQGSVAATFAALQAASTAGVDYRAAPSIACVKWWTQPAGPLTADIKGENTGGYTNVVGSIAGLLASLVPVPLKAGTAANANTIRPYVIGIHADSDSETIANVLDRLLLPLSLTWAITAAGEVEILEFQNTTSVETLTAEAVDRVELFRPIKTRRIGYLKNHRVQSDGEISPAATSADSAVYADGTPIDDLRPAEAGANVTESRTAAAILDQGVLAKANAADFATQVTGAQKPANNATVGGVFGVNILESLLGATASLADFKTALGIAAAIVDQGDLAKQNVVTWLTQISGSGKPEDNATVGAAAGVNLKDSAGGSVLALNAIKTILGTAAGIVDQGDLAKKNFVTPAEISVSSLSAIAANLGIITAGLLQSVTGSTQLDLNNNRLLFNNGSVMLVAGVGFGSTSQFILWFGPTQATYSACTESNATFYLKANGSAYFGGALSAGTLTTKASTSSTAADAVAETAVFGSNGGTITVTLSLNYSSFERRDYLGTSGDLSNWNADKGSVSPTPTDPDADGVYTAGGTESTNTTVALYRSINGGAYVQVATLSAAGAWDWEGRAPVPADTAPGYSERTETIGGSITYTDPANVAQDRQYKAVMTGRTARYTNALSQAISIIAVEQ